MDSKRRIRLFCTALVAVVLMLGLLLMLAVCGGMPAGHGTEEGTRQSLADLLLGDLLGGEIFPETIDWETETDEPLDHGVVEMDGSLSSSDNGGFPGAEDDTPVMNLYAEVQDRVYLKTRSFGDYTGRGFAEAEAYPSLCNNTTVDFIPAVAMEAVEETPVYRLEIEPILPVSVLPYYVCEREGQLPVSDVLVEGNSNDRHAVTYRELSRGNTEGAARRVRNYELEYRHFARDQYLTLDKETERYMLQIIKKEGFSKSDPSVIAKVAAYIRGSATYNPEYNPELDEASNIAIALLQTYKEGVCRHYAAAATLLYRALGIPARYTVGFAATTIPDDTTVVTMGQAHAWVEVYVDGFGWRCVEVTGSMGNEGDGELEGGEVLGMNGSLAGGKPTGQPILNLYGEIEDRVYLKMQSFGAYTGQGFAPAQVYDGLVNGYSADFLPHYVMEASASQGVFTLEIEPLVPVSVLPYYISSRDGAAMTSDVTVKGNEESRHFAAYRHVSDYNTKQTPQHVRDFEKEYRAFVYKQYLSLDDLSRQYMEILIKREGFSAKDPEIIDKVAGYIQNAAVYNMEYNPKLDQEINVALAFLRTYKEGVCRHYAAAATLLFRALGIPARYTVGFAATTVPGGAVTVTDRDAHAWVEVYVDGFGWQYVEVTGSSDQNPEGTEPEPDDDYSQGEMVMLATLRPAAQSKKYDGTPLFHDGTLDGFELFEEMGYSYHAEVAHETITIGTTAVEITGLTIYDAAGTDVTDKFQLTLLKNVLRIYYEKLTFSGCGYSKVYDGKPLSISPNKGVNGYFDVQFVDGNMPADMTWTMTPTGERTTVGKSAASFRVTLMQNGEDVTNFYYVMYNYGTLDIAPAPLTLYAPSVEKKYDGLPLTAPYIDYDPAQLAEGHRIHSYTVEGERTFVGRSSNVITKVIIVNQNGMDVTANYAIECIDGTLRVTP